MERDSNTCARSVAPIDRSTKEGHLAITRPLVRQVPAGLLKTHKLNRIRLLITRQMRKQIQPPLVVVRVALNGAQRNEVARVLSGAGRQSCCGAQRARSPASPRKCRTPCKPLLADLLQASGVIALHAPTAFGFGAGHSQWKISRSAPFIGQ
jgi:hypothetical protein